MKEFLKSIIYILSDKGVKAISEWENGSIKYLQQKAHVEN